MNKEIKTNHIKKGWQSLVCGFVFAASIVLFGCEEESTDQTHVAPSPNGAQTVPQQAPANWLDVKDDRQPGPWLAERDIALGFLNVSEGGNFNAHYIAYGALLARAERHYHETPRMIANRIAQVIDEVGPSSPHLSHMKLLSDFLFKTENERRQTLGEVMQHYLILRRKGLDHATTLDDIRRAYGAHDDDQ